MVGKNDNRPVTNQNVCKSERDGKMKARRNEVQDFLKPKNACSLKSDMKVRLRKLRDSKRCELK